MKEEVSRSRPSLPVWLTDQAAFMDLFVAFNLGGFGLIFAGLGWALAGTQLLPPDTLTGVAFGTASLGLLMIFGCVRLVRARSAALRRPSC